MSEQTQRINPENVLKLYYEAMNRSQTGAAFALFAVDAVRREKFASDPDQIIAGQDRIQAGIRARVKDNIEIEAWDFQVEGNTVTCMARVSTDYGRQVGFAPVEEAVKVIIDQNGKIKEFIVIVTAESCARIEAAEANS